jgi:hypothetical protein
VSEAGRASDRCADLSLEAGEQLGATAVVAESWLVLEVPGAWPRDVGDGASLPAGAREAVSAWLSTASRPRLQFVRRPRRSGGSLLAFLVRSGEKEAWVRRVELGALEELATLDPRSAGEVVDRSLVLVCGHGSRDRCCASRGTELFELLDERLEEEELWISSHLGGHRFAPNLLVLPSGLQFGRIPPDDALFLIARALAGRIDLDAYRGRTCYERAIQAAELAVRREAHLDGIADLALEAVEEDVITFATSPGSEYTVVVQEVAGPAVPASCGAKPEPQSHFAAASVTLNPGRAADMRGP